MNYILFTSMYILQIVKQVNFIGNIPFWTPCFMLCIIHAAPAVDPLISVEMVSIFVSMSCLNMCHNYDLRALKKVQNS